MGLMQYNIKLIIAILILAIVLMAGCTQLSSIACKPNWVLGFQFPIVGPVNNMTDDSCKSQCYAADTVTSHKIENNYICPDGSTVSKPNLCLNAIPMQSCYCDVNNCNP